MTNLSSRYDIIAWAYMCLILIGWLNRISGAVRIHFDTKLKLAKSKYIMSSKEACYRWMWMVEKSGSFKKWLDQQETLAKTSCGNDKAACKKWLETISKLQPTVIDLEIEMNCNTCGEKNNGVNICRNCKDMSCIACIQKDDRCKWCGEVQGYARNRGAKHKTFSA